MSSEFCVSVIFSLQRVCSPARSFARQGPLERVPPRHSSYCALRPLDARPARFLLPFRSCPRQERRDFIPGSWTALAYMPRPTIPVGDAIETAGLGSPGRASLHLVAFDRVGGLGTRFKVNFGTQSRGLHARCLRFEITLTRVRPYDLARLASGVA